MEGLIEDLKNRKEKALSLGGRDKVDRQHELGRYTARERIDKLVDESSFQEWGILNHSDLPGAKDKSPADGLVTGLAKVEGRPVVILASDKTVFAGAEGKVYIRKMRKLRDYAIKRGFPIIELGEGGGLRMPDGMGSDGITESIPTQSDLRKGRQVPYITAVLGDSFGGPTWSAVTSDFVVQLKGTCLAVGGPRMLEIATGEKVSPEELGGWELHSKVTGQIDETADTEEEAFEKVKQFLSFLPQNGFEEAAIKETKDDMNRRVEEAITIVPTRKTQAYNMKDLIKVIVDEHEFFEIKPLFGQALITGFGRLNGRSVGIIASQPMYNAGALGPNECDKAIDFICLCDSYHIPIIFLNDVPGFLIGSHGERGRVATKIMVWNQALAYSTVPKFTVIIRKSIGMAHANMGGPGIGSDLVVAWPSAEINFTGPEVGVNVVYGQRLTELENAAKERKKLVEQWSFDSSPYKAAAKHLIDDVINPKDTRQFLCNALEAACHQQGSKGERLLANWPTGF